MEKTKNKNPNSDRNASVASYLISLIAHLLLLILLGLLVGRFGGAMEGGAKNLVPIGVVMAAAQTEGTQEQPKPEPQKAPQKTPTVKQPPKTQPQKTVPETVRDADTDVAIPEKATKTQPDTIKPEPAKTQPKNISADAEKPGHPGGSAEATEPSDQPPSNGEGGTKPRDTVGMGRTDHEGTGTSVGPFPDGAFGLAKTPDCKKDDADNDSLRFTYEVSFTEGILRVVFAGSTTRYDTATIEHTRRIIELGFSPTDIPSEDGYDEYRGEIRCQCGAFPKCELVKK